MNLAALESAIGLDAYHGGIDYEEIRRLGLTAEQIIDFSSNVLVVPHPPEVLRAIASVSLSTYPDRECLRLRESLAAQFQLSPEQIIVGNGCSELIYLVAQSNLRAGDTAVVVGPTFSEYARASRLAGAEVIEVTQSVDGELSRSLDSIKTAFHETAPTVVWICNPNNPNGRCLPRQDILQFAIEHPDIRFVVDESYMDFCESKESLLDAHLPNLVILRSMTKSCSIAGLRLGYAVSSDAALLNGMRLRQIPWSVNALAQVAGIAIIQNYAYYMHACKQIRLDAMALMSRIEQMGFRVIPSTTHYFLIQTPDALLIRKQLLNRGILVRDCTSFGLRDYLRIATRPAEDNARLLMGLKECQDALHSDKDSIENNELAQVSIQSPPIKYKSASFNEEFRSELAKLFRLRRDVRSFKSTPVPRESVKRWLQAACHAPSVGLSQPWRFLSVDSNDARTRVIEEFEFQNRIAEKQYTAEVAVQYGRLKLSGLREAPEHLAVFVDPATEQGRNLGRLTMPETVAYSVVAAIQNFWLAARSEGVGVGWVSILDPARINPILGVPESWNLIAYLCIGWPQVDEDDTPELEKAGWEKRESIDYQWRII